MRLRERAGVRSGRVGVLTDAETDVQAVGLVAERVQQVPQSERILAAGHRDENPLAFADHVVLVDRAPHLLAAMVKEAVATETGVVPPELDHRRFPTPPAFHLVALAAGRDTRPADARRSREFTSPPAPCTAS